MKTLIIHLGAPKCGSSSIQEFFKTYKRPCTQKLRFVMLNSTTINRLKSTSKVDNDDFIILLDKSFEQNDFLILSQEALFLEPLVIRNICDFSSSKVSKIIIIGFCRKSSDFAVSEYNQWAFRDPVRIKESKEMMLKNDLNPIHFLGVERSIISSILNDFSFRLPPVMDWDCSFNQIERLIVKYKAIMRVGILSERDSSETLIQEFCNKADLTLQDKYKEIDIKSNKKFNSQLTESVINAHEFGFKVPGPHEENNKLHDTSKMIVHTNDLNSTLLTSLKNYIDSYFYESNLNFCNRYGFEKSYFAPSKKISKNEILEMVKKEMEYRISNNTMINYYKKLSGIMAQAMLNCNEINKNVNYQPKYYFSFMRLLKKK